LWWKLARVGSEPDFAPVAARLQSRRAAQRRTTLTGLSAFNLVPATPRPFWRALVAVIPAYLQLCKARLSSLVVATAAAGFVLGARDGFDLPRFAWTMLGTLLAAYGANALNQWLEAARDARMERTRGRPLPTGRLRHRSALAFGLLTGLGGPLLLATWVDAGAGSLALAALLIYVLFYTPLKVRTTLNTLVGAVVGALPPLVGWVGATGQLGAGAWILGGVLFLWQIPHFLALAWLYRDDYQRAGFRMLAIVDPFGRLTGCLVVVYTLGLLLLTIHLTLVGVAGWVYALGALVLGTGLLIAGVLLERRPSRAAARRLFLASVIYLPLLLGLMVLDRRP
jgi:protoheme IX farnesyltransferase